MRRWFCPKAMREKGENWIPGDFPLAPGFPLSLATCTHLSYSPSKIGFSPPRTSLALFCLFLDPTILNPTYIFSKVDFGIGCQEPRLVCLFSGPGNPSLQWVSFHDFLACFQVSLVNMYIVISFEKQFSHMNQRLLLCLAILLLEMYSREVSRCVCKSV